MVSGFYGAMLDEDIASVGVCMLRGKQELEQAFGTNIGFLESFLYGLNMVGDPGTPMICGLPGTLQVQELPGTLAAGAQTLSLIVTNENGSPAEGVAVCAWMDEERTVVGLTDEAGHVFLSLPWLEAGTLRITASKAFHFPVQHDLSVVADQALPLVARYDVLDANGDSLWLPGEAAQLWLSIENSSTTEAIEDLVLTLRALDEGVDCSGEEISMDVIQAGETIDVSQSFALNVPQTMTNGFPVRLVAEIDWPGNTVLHRLDLLLDTPVISPVSAAFDQPLEPGDTRTLNLLLSNRGNMESGLLFMNIAADVYNRFSYSPSNFTLPSLAPGQGQTVELSVHAADDLIAGSPGHLEITWTNELQLEGSFMQGFTSGSRLPHNPSGPDAYGYYAFENADLAYPQAPVYDWFEIAPAAGGPGQLLALNDYYNERDVSRFVPLPFEFTLYGESYSEVAICSNGFAAFGENANLETDFRNHPFPSYLGPEPMLAPMWDDHLIVQGAEVATYYDEGGGRFIIEWYRVRTNSNLLVNTFQLILYDPAVHVTQTGDGPFAFQYFEFNDGQVGDMDFDLCSVGIKNQDASTGINLKFLGNVDPTMHPIVAGTSIYFTTLDSPGSTPPAPVLGEEALGFNLSHTEPQTLRDSLLVTNSGEQTLVLQIGSGTGQGATTDYSVPDEAGYYWVDSDELTGPQVGWVEEPATSQALAFEGEDDVLGPIEIGFDFPFYGELHSQLWVSSNGFVSLDDPGDAFQQNNVGGLPSTAAPDKAFLAWWDDLLDAGSLASSCWLWSNNQDRLVVSWVEAPHGNPVTYGGPFTFQIVLEKAGTITYNYGDMSSDDMDSDSGTIGWQLNEETGTEIHSIQERARSNYSLQIHAPGWFEFDHFRYAVAPQTSRYLGYQVTNAPHGVLLQEGVYQLLLHFYSNSPENPVLTVQASMSVNDLDVDQAERPRVLQLGQAVPNPFNNTTSLRYQLAMPGHLQARLFNLAGQQLRVLEAGYKTAGEHLLVLEGDDLASGVYFVELKAADERVVRKLMLLK